MGSNRHANHGDPSEHEEFPTLAAAAHDSDDMHDAHDDPSPEDDACAIDASAGPRRVGFGVVLFAAIAIAAILSIWFMRATLRAETDGKPDSDAGKLVASFLAERGSAQAVRQAAPRRQPLGFEDVAHMQVAVERLARNPFKSPARVAELDPTAASARGPAEVDAASASAPAASESTHAGRVASWEREVDASVADFRIESVLVGRNPANSVVSMNGGVFRVGDGVMFPDRAVRFVLESIEPGVITLRAKSDELGCDRVVSVEVRRSR
jgi:hypothetical protein